MYILCIKYSGHMPYLLTNKGAYSYFSSLWHLNDIIKFYKEYEWRWISNDNNMS